MFQRLHKKTTSSGEGVDEEVGKGKRKGSRKGNCRLRGRPIAVGCRGPRVRVGERPQLPQKTSAASSVKLRAFTPSRENLVRSPPSYHSVADARVARPSLPLSHFDDFSAELEENIAAEVAETASQEGLNRRRRRRRPATLSSPSGGAAPVGEAFQSGK